MKRVGLSVAWLLVWFLLWSFLVVPIANVFQFEGANFSDGALRGIILFLGILLLIAGFVRIWKKPRPNSPV